MTALFHATQPTLHITLPPSVGWLIEDDSDDSTVWHLGQVRPRTNVVDDNVALHMRRTLYPERSISMGRT